MEPRTIDELLADLSGTINFANPEQFRLKVMDFVRLVIADIGIEYVGVPFVEKCEVLGYYLKLPSFVMKVDDLSFDGINWTGYQIGRDMNTDASLAFVKFGTTYRLPNLPVHDGIYVKGIGLERNEYGEGVLPIEIYDAVERYCVGRLLEGQALHPLFNDRYNILQQAELAKAKARRDLTPNSFARERTERHATGQISNRNINSKFW